MTPALEAIPGGAVGVRPGKDPRLIVGCACVNPRDAGNTVVLKSAEIPSGIVNIGKGMYFNQGHLCCAAGSGPEPSWQPIGVG